MTIDGILHMREKQISVPLSSNRVFDRCCRKGGRSSGAFTLIELLIVIAIILILVSIALPNMLEARMRSQVVHAYGEMKALTEAEDIHFLDHKSFTHDIIDPGDDYRNSLTTPIRYLKEVPLDPFGKYTNQGPTKTLAMYRIGTGNAAVGRPTGF